MHTKQSVCQLSYNTVLLRLFSFHSSMQCVSVEERRTIALFQLNSTQPHFHPGVKAYVYPVYWHLSGTEGALTELWGHEESAAQEEPAFSQWASEMGKPAAYLSDPVLFELHCQCHHLRQQQVLCIPSVISTPCFKCILHSHHSLAT